MPSCATPLSLLLYLSKGVLEAQIEKDCAVAFARTDAERNGDAGHDLKTALEVVRPSYTGIQKETVLTLLEIGADYLFGAVPCSLEHDVEARRELPDDALTEIVTKTAGFVAGGVSRRRRVGTAGVPMSNNRVVKNNTRRDVYLVSNASGSKSSFLTTSRRQQRETGSNSDHGVAIAEKLVSIIDREIADASIPFFGAPRNALNRQGKAELMLDAGNRPLLSERVDPVTSAIPPERAYVLDDTVFLIVCLLNQKTVVLDRLCRRRCLEPRSRRRTEHDRQEQKGDFHGRAFYTSAAPMIRPDQAKSDGANKMIQKSAILKTRVAGMAAIFLLTVVAIPAAIDLLTQAAERSADKACRKIIDDYVREFLRRNPAVSTYRGGAGIDPALAELDGSLRDHSGPAIEAEDRWLSSTLESLERLAPAGLSPSLRTEREVALAQIRFLLHQHQVRRYQRRALDTYTDEPFRAIDAQLQSMTPSGSKSSGTEKEWSLLTKRLRVIPVYMAAAETQLSDGIKANNTPDFRMLKRNGIDTTEADAVYFEKTLPRLAEERITGPNREQLLAHLRDASEKAAAAYRSLNRFVASRFFEDPFSKSEAGVKSQFRGDRFAMGEAEYNWALKNNLKISKSANELYEESWPVVEATRREMFKLAREIGKTHGWSLPEDDAAAVRAVFDQLSKDYPKSDDEMIEWYRLAALRLVDYARKTGIFDVPADYRLEVAVTPPPLRASIDGAVYFPAPPLRNVGVGRFYVTPTGNNPAALQAHNRAALADLAAHEGFPGHDWHYKVMTERRAEISPLGWLTPGGIEDSSSMWMDSMMAEGWALYAEALMAEPQPGAPAGFYTPEERLYQLQGKLYRDLRVRIDTGLHTGRMKYDEAVDLFSQVVNFLPGSCRENSATANKVKRASCESAERAIFRYSKWPTQAITYRIGKEDIIALRSEAAKKAGGRFAPKQFHLLVLTQGRIPVGYFREKLLNDITRSK